jgi:GTP:adenosylcobinamide-phosphate guanylyltransferase
MYAIVTAGGIPTPEDPLYPFLKGDAKALVDVAGKPMIQWVLDALNAAKQVDDIILIGLSAKSGLASSKPIHYVPNQGRMLSNLVAGVNKALELNNKTDYVLIVSSDIPALKGDMVDWLISRCMETEDELYYGVCLREVMEARFPDSRRTYTRLKDMDLCGSDINVTHVRMATEHLDLWEKLIGNRKSPMRQAAIIGLDIIWKIAVTHSLTLDVLVEEVCKRLGIKGRAIVWEHAEPCMDVDKPHQLELLRADLEKEQAREKRAEKTIANKAAVKKSAAPKAVAKKIAPKVKPVAKKASPKVAAKKTAVRKKAK